MNKLCIALCMLLPLAAFSQAANNTPENSATKGITAKLVDYATTHTTEKAYLQFDKPYYAVGDTIYFKAYITIGAQHKLSALSGVLNVELIGPNNKVSRSVKLQVQAGTATGDFALADTLQGDTYRIRAYTNWMRNEGEDSFFEQLIPVGATGAKGIPESAKAAKTRPAAKSVSNKPDVQFLPEGGSLVAGNYSRIAFKAIGPDGMGTNIKGTITDDAGNEVSTFTSAHLGMGSFNLVPQAGKAYKANITYADGTTNTVDLPKATNTGYTININNTNADTIRLRITAGPESSLGKLSLIAQAGGTVYYAAENQQTGAKFFSASIPKNKFPTGIVQFTLFSPAGEPLNERMLFIQNHDELKLKVSTDKQAYAARQKVQINLMAKNKENAPAMGSFSVAITDETTAKPDTLNDNTLLSYLLLTSELRGTIEQPGYYFPNADDTTQANLDLLMLTQGYRHFEWKQVLNETQPAIAYQPEKALEISGVVKKWNKPVNGAKVKLFSNKNGIFMLDTVTDKAGKFRFNDLVFADSTKFVAQAKVPRGQDAVTLEVDTTLLSSLGVKPLKSGVKTIDNGEMAAYVINQKQFYIEQQKYGINKHAMLLNEVRVKAKYKPTIPHSDNLNGPGNADFVLTTKDIEKMICARLAECLMSRIPSLRFVNGVPQDMAVVIDGNFVDPDVFNTLSTDNIEGIEIIKGYHYGAVYGPAMANGGFIITTKRGQKANNYYRYAPGVVTYMPKGFYKAREFYSPQYDNPKTNQKIPDLRSTIYWKPDIITDKDGKASFSFFNADGKGTYRVVVEGIDADGNLGRQVYRYKVE